MSRDYVIVFCTCPDFANAKRLAEYLVENRLAACVNILPGLTSVYHWEGRICSDSEHLLLIKSKTDRYGLLEAALQREHPYELPEIVSVSLENGSQDYLKWIDSCLTSD